MPQKPEQEQAISGHASAFAALLSVIVLGSGGPATSGRANTGEIYFATDLMHSSAALKRDCSNRIEHPQYPETIVLDAQAAELAGRLSEPQYFVTLTIQGSSDIHCL